MSRLLNNKKGKTMKIIKRIKEFFFPTILPPGYTLLTNGNLWKWEKDGYISMFEYYLRTDAVRHAWRAYRLLKEVEFLPENEFKKEN